MSGRPSRTSELEARVQGVFADAQPAAAGTRLLDIAAQRLEAARAMRELGSREAALLDTVDRAARGELPQDLAEEALATHLEAREACLDAMRMHDEEWAELAASLADEATRGRVEAVATEIVSILDQISRADTGFATEIAARRQAARAEVARADGARAAGRAYLTQALGAAEGPRFTDRTV